jgi:orotate phosphoribosyltransferase
MIQEQDEKALKLLVENGCLWKYNEKSKIHAFLTSGKHSDTYVNLSVLNNSNKIKELLSLFPKDDSIDCFCGQAYGSISYAVVMSDIFEKDFIFTEKNSEGVQVLNRYVDVVRKYETICMVEDVLTTGGTTIKAIEFLRKYKNFNFKIRTVINRSGKDYLEFGKDKIQIEKLYNLSSRIWEHNDCELCNKGLLWLAPKSNWRIFIDEMKGENND